MGTIFTGKNGSLMLRDGSGTPWSMVIPFEEGNFSAPIDYQKAAENLRTHRGRLGDSNSYTSAPVYTAGSDDNILAPVEISFEASVLDTVPKKIFAFASCGVLPGFGGVTFTSTAGTTQRRYTDAMSGSSALATVPVYQDANKKTVNLYVRWATSAGAFMLLFNECYFDTNRMTISESGEDPIKLSFTASCLGSIVQYDAAATLPAINEPTYNGAD